MSKETPKQAPPPLPYYPQHVPNILYSLTLNYTQNGPSVYVLANFMCQLEQATVPRYLVKHYSRGFCEGIFLDMINI